MPLALHAVTRPVTTMMAASAAVMLGIVGIRGMSVDLLPSLRLPVLLIRTSCPPWDATVIDGAVTGPLESAIGTVSGLRSLRSLSQQGVSTTRAEFFWGTDMDAALLETRERLDQARLLLPEGAERPSVVPCDPSAEPVMTIALARRADPSSGAGPGNGPDLRALVELKEAARLLVKPRLEQEEGVASVTVCGGAEKEILVQPDRQRMASAGLTRRDLVRALAAANVDQPVGGLWEHGVRFPLRVQSPFTGASDIARVLVTDPRGRGVRLQDVATVTDGFRERSGLTRLNGQEIITLEVRKQAGHNTVALSSQLREVLARLREERPGLVLQVLADQAGEIRRSVSDVEQAGLVGALLSLGVLLLFLTETRYLVVVALSTPLSICVTLGTMYLCGISANVISLSGLALGVGMLGDNAIMVIDTAARLREDGAAPARAAVDGACTISTAVTASTLTNVAVFLPMLLVGGLAQKLFAQMAVTMTLSLMASLLVAVTVVPALLAHGPRPHRALVAAEHRLAPFAQHLAALSDRSLHQYLCWALAHRGTVVMATLLLTTGACVLATRIPAGQHRSIMRERLGVRVQLPAECPLEDVAGFTLNLERQYLAAGAVQVFAAVGRDALGDPWQERGVNAAGAVLWIDPPPGEAGRAGQGALAAITTGIAAAYPGASGISEDHRAPIERLLSTLVGQIEVRVTGPDPEARGAAMESLLTRLQGLPGLAGIRRISPGGRAGRRLVIRPEGETGAWVTSRSVAEQLGDELNSVQATAIDEFDRRVPVVVDAQRRAHGALARGRARVGPLDGDPLAQVLASSVSEGGVRMPLRAAVRVAPVSTVTEVWREDHQPVERALLEAQGAALWTLGERARARCTDIPLPPGCAVAVGGHDADAGASLHGLVLALALSLALVYMILAAEYESLLAPLVVLLTSPLAAIGAIAAMAAAGETYNVLSLVGIIVMIGAVDNDAVIAVDRISALRREGMALQAAVITGMRQRLRPILMTTATTLLGAVPLLLLPDSGSDMARTLAIPVLGGLIASTALTLAAIPVLYALLDRWIRHTVPLPDVR